VPRKLQWTLAGLWCALALLLQVVLFRHAGAFWRDEASTLLISAAPSFGTLWSWLAKDSAPALMYVLVRLWRVAGSGDAWLRLLGVVLFAGLAGSLLVTCRFLTGRAPLVAAALLLLNPTLFYYCSSLRAYGLAVLLVMPCCAAFWLVARNPTSAAVASAALLAILSCHASYQNSYLVLAFGTAAAVACLMCRLWKRSLLVLAIGALAALSLLPYSRAIADYRETAVIISFQVSSMTIAQRLVESVAGDNTALLAAWAILCTCAALLLAARGFRWWRAGSKEPSLEIYMILVLVVANTAGAVFFVAHGIFPHPWHYIPFLAIAALGIEVALQSGRDEGGRASRACLLVSVVVVAIAIVPAWQLAHFRRTNMDRLTALLAARAAPGDLVLLAPFWFAPGFKYYYRGAAEWNTLPLTSTDVENSILPFKAIKTIMTKPRANEPTLDKVRAALSRGNTLWILGWFEFPAPNTPPLDPPPAPAPYGWNSILYSSAWSQQVGALLNRRARNIDPVDAGVTEPVSPFENAPLLRVQGWKEEPTP
jgi:hypothetical protein